jgi:hypothetical protein
MKGIRKAGNSTSIYVVIIVSSFVDFEVSRSNPFHPRSWLESQKLIEKASLSALSVGP